MQGQDVTLSKLMSPAVTARRSKVHLTLLQGCERHIYGGPKRKIAIRVKCLLKQIEMNKAYGTKT